MDFNFFIARVEQVTGNTYTEEQKEFLKDFTKPVISFSDPGTGKTHATVAGLLCTELVHGIPAKNIFACSFTREATGELAARHEALCKKLRIKSKVTFKTVDALCYEMVKTFPDKLNVALPNPLESIKTAGALPYEEMFLVVKDIIDMYSFPIEEKKIRSIIDAIRSLNASMVFDEDHVKTKSKFKKCGISYQEFDTIRREVYSTNKNMGRVEVNDITLYALEILVNSKEVRDYYRSLYKVMVVDEFQDMSLVKLYLLSLVTDNLVVVGDMKQQIYAFNGACAEIVDRYRELFPNRREVSLTQSFRCANEIAEYSKTVIKHNDMGGDSFKGVERENSIFNIENNLDLESIVKGIKEGLVRNKNLFEESVMFLYRTRYSSVPIVDMLYKYQVPVIVTGRGDTPTGHKMAMDIPVIKDICAVIDLALNPKDTSRLNIMNTVLQEFKEFKETPHKSPVYKIMEKTRQSITEVKYKSLKNKAAFESFVSLLVDIKELASKPETQARHLFELVYPWLYKNYLCYIEPYLEWKCEDYIRLTAPLLQKKYDFFKYDEAQKYKFVQDCLVKGVGVRCFTFHASKGTEAGEVHIIDADQGIIPNDKMLEEEAEKGSLLDAARALRNERSLVYVAVTRARKKLYIHYNKDLSSLFTRHNNYVNYDEYYKATVENYDDIKAFKNFTGIKETA